jgi:hypothetical protein
MNMFMLWMGKNRDHRNSTVYTVPVLKKGYNFHIEIPFFILQRDRHSAELLSGSLFLSSTPANEDKAVAHKAPSTDGLGINPVITWNVRYQGLLPDPLCFD